MESAFLSPILSKTKQVLDFIQRWEVSPSSSSDPRSSILEDLEDLERTLKRIQAVLHDAEEREIRDKAVKLWLEELKEVANDAEDVLDEYHYEDLRAQAESRASRKRKRVEGDDEEEEVSVSISTIVVSIPDGMGDKIRKIKKRFDHISEDRERLRLKEEDGERRVFEAAYQAPTSHMVDESSTFGREHDKKKVIDLLLSEDLGNGISVIPIVGKGGLGKTTIAQLVFNDSKVKEYFNLTGWVSASDDFHVKRLTKEIIESISQRSDIKEIEEEESLFTEKNKKILTQRSDIKKKKKSLCLPKKKKKLLLRIRDLTQLSTLQDILKEKVKGKKVLLVLDDVWNEQQSLWESLRKPFVRAKIVRIIVTCRNDSVAEIMQTVRPHQPGYLSGEESWSLFKHYAFGGRDSKEQSRLADIGKQIVEKCSGLPLAVKSIGSLLRHETDEDSWMEVLQSGLWELDKNNETLASLRLSYIRMPAHLKPCFVYCSMFPKDYVFHTDHLVRLWMAQGYITPRGRRRMEDVGNEYFNDLQRRTFFDFFDGEFKMHDMIHDLAKSIAGNECYAIVDKKLPDSPDKVHHLFVEDKNELVKSLGSQNLRALRTLLLPYLHVSPFPLLLLRTGCLRTLEFSWQSEDELPDSIGNLKHLRYLLIKAFYIQRLPESVCLLYHLQTLILYCDVLAELPDGLGDLTDLRYFRLETYVIQRLPNSVRQLHNLQTLDLRSCRTLKELPSGVWQLCNLQMLDLHQCRNLKELPSGMESLTNLRHLDIENTGIHYLPAWIGTLTNLQRLPGCFEVQSGIRVLKDLVNLQETLHISRLKNLVNIEDARDACLKYKHKLEELFLNWFDDSYKRGSELILYACPKLNMDVPLDEKREEAMLENLQPHTNLKSLLICGYGGSKFPKWVGNPFSFASLREISIMECENIRFLPLYIHDSLGKLGATIPREPLPSMLERVYISACRQLTSIVGLYNLHSLKYLAIYDCPQLLLLSEKGLPPKIEELCIENCQQLTSLLGTQNITSLREITIKNCPQLLLLSKKELPSKLRKLHIEKCQQLTSMLGMQNLTSLEALTIKNCTKLQSMTEDQLSSMPHHVEIADCPRLVDWCQIQKINYI